MTPEGVVNLVQRGVETMILVSAPLLIAALVTGLLISIFQAATQINESTLSFIPKMVVMLVVMVVAGPWMLRMMIEFTRTLFSDIPQLIGAG